MEIKELIAQLLDKQRGQSAEMRVLLGTAAGTIENLLGQADALKAELRDERHRHDRYVDFELAEAEELRKLKEQLRWIPVTERMPEYDLRDVLAYDGICCCLISYTKTTRDGRKYFVIGHNDITHWMPLP